MVAWDNVEEEDGKKYMNVKGTEKGELIRHVDCKQLYTNMWCKNNFLKRKIVLGDTNLCL